MRPLAILRLQGNEFTGINNHYQRALPLLQRLLSKYKLCHSSNSTIV